jgi:uncharacterized protein (TIGR02246 family)
MKQSNDNTSFSADVLAIQDVLNRLVNCWNHGDAFAYGECFTEDADYVDVTGMHSQGREAIVHIHEMLFNGPLKGSQLEANANVQPTIELLADTVALVVKGGTSRLAGQEKAPDDRQSVNTTVLVKRDGQWKIRAFQNNRVLPPSFFAGMSGKPGQQGKA